MATFYAYEDIIQDNGSIRPCICAKGDVLEAVKSELGIELRADFSHGWKENIQRAYVMDSNGTLVHEEGLGINVAVDADYTPDLVDTVCSQCDAYYSIEAGSKVSQCPVCGHIEGEAVEIDPCSTCPLHGSFGVDAMVVCASCPSCKE